MRTVLREGAVGRPYVRTPDPATIRAREAQMVAQVVLFGGTSW